MKSKINPSVQEQGQDEEIEKRMNKNNDDNDNKLKDDEWRNEGINNKNNDNEWRNNNEKHRTCPGTRRTLASRALLSIRTLVSAMCGTLNQTNIPHVGVP